MNTPSPRRLPEALLALPAVRAVLELFTAIWRCAQQVRRPLFDFALHEPLLLNTGLTPAQLQVLVESGVIEQRLQTPEAAVEGAILRLSVSPTSELFPTYFLTEAGVALVASLAPSAQAPAAHSEPPCVFPLERPLWVLKDYELHFRGRLVKRFRRQAPSQFTVLNAFEAHNWAISVANPLDPEPAATLQQRLNDTLDSLNDISRSPLWFSASADHQSIMWEVRRGRK